MKRHVKATLVTAALVGVGAVAGCSSSGSGGSTGSSATAAGNANATISNLQIGSAAVSTLNYDDSNIGYASGLGNLVLEPLLIEGKSGKIEPWLAQSWQQVNPTTYVYHLRHGVKFSDGDPMTAADVVFSWDFYRAQGSDNAYNFPSSLQSITATDPYTVTVKLSQPDAAWAVVPTGAMLGIFEKKFYEAHKSTFGQPGTGVMGTGPWSITSYDSTTGTQLAANPNYWGGQVKIKNISWTFYASETSEALAFPAWQPERRLPDGEPVLRLDRGHDAAHRAWFDPGGRLRHEHARCAVEQHPRAGGRRLRAGQDGPHFRQRRLRHPISTLITPAMLDELGTPSQVSATLNSLPSYSYSLAKAKQQMAESPYPHGVNVTLAVQNTPSYRQRQPGDRQPAGRDRHPRDAQRRAGRGVDVAVHRCQPDGDPVAVRHQRSGLA